MPLPSDLPVVDHHCHLSPHGEGVRAAERFRATGGTHLFLATQNYLPGVPRSLEAYRRQFETTHELGRRIREETGVVVYSVLAPYPVDLLDQVPALGRPAAVELHRQALEVAGKLVRDRRAVAIGEVGRPHFPVPDDVAATVETVLQLALETARDADCPAIVHCGDLDREGFLELAERGRDAGLPAHRIVKHYARARVPPGDRGPVAPSYLARRELVREVLADPGPWFLETDFLDDPTRPGAVLDLTTIPRRATALSAADPAAADRLREPFVESIRRVYGWRPERGPEGAA